MPDTSEELWAFCLSESQRMKQEVKKHIMLSRGRGWKTDFRGRPRRVKHLGLTEYQAQKLQQLWD